MIPRLLAAVVGLHCGILAATGQSPGTPADTSSLIPYADASFGFEMRLPGGWALDRARFQEYEGSIGLLRGRSPSGQHSLQIVVFREFKGRAFDEWVLEFAKLLVELSGGAAAETQARVLGERDGAVRRQPDAQLLSLPGV
jgi:hypothetical protein